MEVATRKIIGGQSVVEVYMQHGDLVLMEHDLTPGVESIFGDSDVEYFLTVRRQSLPRLVAALEAETRASAGGGAEREPVAAQGGPACVLRQWPGAGASLSIMADGAGNPVRDVLVLAGLRSGAEIAAVLDRRGRRKSLGCLWFKRSPLVGGALIGSQLTEVPAQPPGRILEARSHWLLRRLEGKCSHE